MITERDKNKETEMLDIGNAISGASKTSRIMKAVSESVMVMQELKSSRNHGNDQLVVDDYHKRGSGR